MFLVKLNQSLKILPYFNSLFTSVVANSFVVANSLDPDRPNLDPNCYDTDGIPECTSADDKTHEKSSRLQSLSFNGMATVR